MHTETLLDRGSPDTACLAVRSLAHLGIRVRDFTRSITFYRQFGFRMIREDRHERIVVLRHASGLELNLLDSVSGGGSRDNVLMDRPARHPGYTHMALRIADVQQARQRLDQLGIEITEGPVTFGDGSTSIFFRDPDRNVIELAQAAGDNPDDWRQGAAEQ